MSTLRITTALLGVLWGTAFWGGPSPAEKEAAARQRPAAAPRDARAQKAIAEFLAIEQIARLPREQREAQIPHLYRDLAPRFMSIFVEGILSSFPASLFRRGDYLAPGDHRDIYARQLDAAATLMTPQQMADAIYEAHGNLILALATKVRCIQSLEGHKGLVRQLVEKDLDSDELAAVRRACATIHTLRLKDFNQRLLAVYLADGKYAAEARSAILWLNDAAMTAALVADIEKNPAAVRRHYGLLNGMLWGRAAEPALVKLLGSPDGDIRHCAAMALQDCKDASLASHVRALLVDNDPRMKLAAAHMAGRLPHAAFKPVREALLKLLAEKDLELRIEAARAYAEHKDDTGAPVLLELWQQPLPEELKVRVMGTVAKLAGTTFNYDMHQWAQPTPANLKAIEAFRQWIFRHEPLEPGAD